MIVTHSHPDHFGGAARFARDADAAVVAHRSFRFGVLEATQEPEVSVDDLAAGRERRGAPPRRHRLEPPHAVGRRSIRARRSRCACAGGVARWLGARSFRRSRSRCAPATCCALAKREWFVRHTPGHTEDHICLHDPADGLFLSGDHVLPSITPHISGLTLSKDPLDNFFDSLDRVAAMPNVTLVLPAHGHPFSRSRGTLPRRSSSTTTTGSTP